MLQVEEEIAQWRKLRNEARALALETDGIEARDTLMRIATEYNRLVHRAEERLSIEAKQQVVDKPTASNDD